jgi:microcystin-dependent protein
MADQFLSEIRMMAFGYAPRGWALCNGQLMPINQNQALFSLLGTNFGGDGRTTFGLPDLRGRVPIHAGSGFDIGAKGGEPAHTLSVAEMPPHIHDFMVSNARATDNGPDPARGLAASTPQNAYGPATNPVIMSGQAVSNAGGSVAHQNIQPCLTISFCIALQGSFPSRN